MENLCRQYGYCSAVPPEWHWLMAIIMPLAIIILVGLPVANIVHRAGHSRWWTILAFVPFVESDHALGIRIRPLAERLPRLARSQISGPTRRALPRRLSRAQRTTNTGVGEWVSGIAS